MKIKWLGHSSFLITSSSGKKILTDPFDGSVGYKIYEGDADLVTISHHHFDHDYTEGFRGNPKVIDKVGVFNISDIDFEGIPSFHDKYHGAKRGENIIFIFQIDGYTICHLGDLGYELSNAEINKLGNVDILLIPTGGNFTITAIEATRVALSINSHIVIPMHYKTPSLSFPLSGVEDFVMNMKNGEKLGSNTLIVEGKLEGFNIVKIPDYK